MECERKRKRAKEREKNEGRLGKRTFSSPVSPRFFPALSLDVFFARAPLSERLEQATSRRAQPNKLMNLTRTAAFKQHVLLQNLSQSETSAYRILFS